MQRTLIFLLVGRVTRVLCESFQKQSAFHILCNPNIESSLYQSSSLSRNPPCLISQRVDSSFARSFSLLNVRFSTPLRANRCLLRGSISNGNNNSTDIYGSVGATGNLRFKKTGTNPVDQKRDEPNFKVKPLEETSSVQENATAASSASGSTTLFNNDGQKQARFETICQEPHGKDTLHLIAPFQGEFVEDILDSIGSIVNASRSDLKHSFRDNGKWRSITVEVPVESAAQLYDVYAAIGRDPRVKFKF